MGNSESQEMIEYIEQNYQQISYRQDPFFGNYSLLTDSRTPRMLIKKDITFRNQGEYQQYLKEFSKIDRKPFSLVYPKRVVEKKSFQNCSTVREAKVYFEVIGKSLFEVVRQEGLFSEVKAWFLLNQISKALEIMEESYNRSHWAISPETVFRNNTNNYLLYDSFFVFGNDPTHFLTIIKQNYGPLTERIKMLLERGSTPGHQEGEEQDTYALGFTIIYCLTGITSTTLPPYLLQPLDIENLLKSKNLSLSRQIIDLLKSLTHRNSSKRMNIIQLRRLLKEKEADIIHNESNEYLHSRRKSKSNQPHQHNPHLVFRQQQLQQQPRVRFNSPSFSMAQIHEPTDRRIEFSPLTQKPHLKPQMVCYGQQEPRISLKGQHFQSKDSNQLVVLSRLKSLDWNRPKK